LYPAGWLLEFGFAPLAFCRLASSFCAFLLVSRAGCSIFINGHPLCKPMPQNKSVRLLLAVLPPFFFFSGFGWNFSFFLPLWLVWELFFLKFLILFKGMD
jgi:hypothetical protein